MRRSILARREVPAARSSTALNLLPSMATRGSREQAQGATQRNKPGADLANGAAIYPCGKSRYRLVIWSQAPRQPHHLDVAPSLGAQAGGSTGPDRDSRRCRASVATHGRKVGRSPRARHRPTQAQQDRVRPQRRRSPELDCPRRSSARDPCPQRSVSSDPPQMARNHIARITSTARFHTARVRRSSVPGGCSIRSISTRLDPGGTASLPSQPKL